MEIHFICYLCNEHDQLTEKDIQSICTDCISQCPIFALFSKEFKSNYTKASIQHKELKAELDKVNKDVMLKFGNRDNFNQKIDELNQETETLIDEIDKWQT